MALEQDNNMQKLSCKNQNWTNYKHTVMDADNPKT